MGQAESPHAKKVKGPQADQELALSLDSKIRLEQLMTDYAKGRPEGGTDAFRSKIDALIDRLKPIEKLTEPNIYAVFSDVYGKISQITAKASPSMDDVQRLECQANFAYREHARKFAGEGMATFSVPNRQNPMTENFQLNDQIDLSYKRALTHPDREQGLLDFVKFLSSRISDKNQRWNSVNIVTALYKLSELEPKWSSRVFGSAIGEQIINKLATIADKQIFDGQSVANLAGSAPTLIDVVERLQPKNPILEKRLFGALSKAVEYTQEKPSEQFADKSFLEPLREISSRNLTDEGAVALCSYIAKLNHLFSHMTYARSLGTIASTFHALNGISSWTLRPESDTQLTVMLRNLNDRLQGAHRPLDSATAGSIIYGLKGLDVSNLSPAAVEQVARTIRLVTKKLDESPPHITINHASVSAMVKGLTLALEARDGPIFNATQQLVGAIERRMPPRIMSFNDLGCVCGALVTLRPHTDHYKDFAKRLHGDALNAATYPLLTVSQRIQDQIAWQVSQQAFALYRAPIPEPLKRILNTLAPLVVSSVRPTRSEARITEWARNHPGVAIDPTRFQDGFELDILIGDLNVEVDGSFHRGPAKARDDKQRDEHLKTKGYRVLRVPSNISKEDFDAKLSAALKEARAS